MARRFGRIPHLPTGDNEGGLATVGHHDFRGVAPAGGGHEVTVVAALGGYWRTTRLSLKGEGLSLIV